MSEIGLSVVVPVYGNEASIRPLLVRLNGLDQALPEQLEVVFVDDGSPDRSVARLEGELPSATFRWKIVRHSRNFGSFAAIRTGLIASSGRFVGVLAADLQEPPELLIEFFRVLRTGSIDVVIGRRTARDDSFITSGSSSLFWRLYRRFVNSQIPPGGVDVFACSRQVAEQLCSLPESHSSLVGLLFWVGFRRAEVPYARAAREHGTSAWTNRKRVRYLLDSVFAFTDLPIKLLTALGAVGAILTTFVGLIVLIERVSGGIQQAGYTPLMLVVLLATFLLLFAIGIVGSYVWRTFENSKGRPLAIVAGSIDQAPESTGGHRSGDVANGEQAP